MSLRRFFIASSLILAPITTLGFGSAAFADTATDSIILSGTVESQIAINATPNTDSTNLPMTQLSQSGANVVLVAALNITSNNTAGITITASSTNNGALVSSENNENEIPYTIAIVNNGAGTPSTSATSSLSSFGQNVTGFDPETGLKSMDLYISYDVGGMPKQGNYSDTLTITVSDN